MSIWTILIAILMFSLLIFVHELGHFMAAKWAKMKVNEFAFGMGPTLFGFTRGETKYAVHLFPIGGFVAVEGENEDSDDSRSFYNISVWKRMIFTVAGAVMNLALGLAILAFLSSQQQLFGTTQIAVFANDAVSSSQLEVGDTIQRVNGRRVSTSNDLIYEFMRSRNGLIDLVVTRNNEDIPMTVQFRMDEAVDSDGASFIYLDFRVVGVESTLWGTVKYTFNWTASIIKQVWGSLVDLVTGRFGFTQLSGPVGVTEAIGQASSAGYDSLLLLVGFITVNLGVFNMMPFPALDGGRLIFLLIEVIRRKPINPRYEGMVNAAGFIALIGLMIAVTFSDLFKIFTR